MIRQYQKSLNLMHIFVDICVLLLSLGLAYLIGDCLNLHDKFENISINITTLIVIILLYITLHMAFFAGLNTYKSYRATGFAKEFGTIVRGNLYSFTLISIISFLSFNMVAFQILLTISLVINLLIMGLYRFTIRQTLKHWRKKGYNKKYMLIVEVNDCTEQFISKINDSPDMGYELVGYISDEKYKFDGVKHIGKTNILKKFIANNMVDEIVLMPADNKIKEASEIISLCEEWGVKFSLIPNMFSVLKSRVTVSSFDGLPMMNIRSIPLDNIVNSVIKRLFDIVCSLLAIVIFSPIMVFVALSIKLSSRGPIIFKQTRVGLNRKTFSMYKFRSMRVDTEDIVKMAEKNDDRCTKIGRFIRKFSIDELPQLFNVIKGEMSLIGPRPEIPKFVEKFRKEIPSYMLKHYIKPGMTGWAQVSGLRGGETSITERIKFDMYYVENWTFMFDIKIMILTVFRGFFNKNAF